jgi:serine/threonine protein kinase
MYIHNCFQPENIVFKEKEGMNIKIIDFGAAKKLDPEKKVI